MKYRKKPVVIDAVQWTGTNAEEVSQFLGWDLQSLNDPTEGQIAVVSREGIVQGPVGMWVIRGVAGEHYLCDPDIFAKTYDAADEPVSA
jgi:hypothetical protein